MTISLTNTFHLLSNFFTRSYTKTPKTINESQVLTGNAQFLSVDNWNAHDIYMTTPQVYTVIQRRGALLAAGVWKHLDKNDKEIENSEYVKLLNNPNVLMNGNDFIKQWNENKCVYGNNYEYVNRGLPSMTPSTLTNLPPAEIEIVTTGKTYKQTKLDEIISHYRFINGATTERIETKDINQTRIVSGKNTIKGESPLVSLYMPISNIRGAYGFRNILINKKGALGILSNNSKDSAGAIPLTSTERLKLEKEYQNMYGMEDDQAKVIMTNTTLSWQAMTFPTKDLMLFEEIREDFNAIIDAFGMHINLFSVEKGSTFTNMNESLKQVYQNTIVPEAEELALNRTRLFGLDLKGEKIVLDYSNVPALQENMLESSQVMKNKTDALNTLTTLGVYSPEEIKQIINL
jgi:HK97 family phage portal protein